MVVAFGVSRIAACGFHLHFLRGTLFGQARRVKGTDRIVLRVGRLMERRRQSAASRQHRENANRAWGRLHDQAPRSAGPRSNVCPTTT